jgi:hypothetical protein
MTTVYVPLANHVVNAFVFHNQVPAHVVVYVFPLITNETSYILAGNVPYNVGVPVNVVNRE